MRERSSPGESVPEGRLVVAVSGGVDSMVLLHRLRFGGRRSGDLVVAHLDHGMRPGSHRDAAWLRGVCTAWGVPLREGRAERAPSSEEEARRLRYDFLESVRRDVDGIAILTAHHEDDQVETVLFRVLRGTGLRGLAGIPARRGHLLRPLLGLGREEILQYASRHRVPSREDPTNLDPRFARNVLRHRVLPLATESVAAGSRAALLRLARNAARAQEEMEALEAVVMERLLEEVSPGRVEIPEDGVASLPDAVLRRVARASARRVGLVLSESATERAVRGFRELRRGRGVDLGKGVRLARGIGVWLFVRADRAAAGGTSADRVEVLPEEGPGSAVLELGSRRYRVRWMPGPGDGSQGVTVPARLPGPLVMRGWEPGDRIRLPYGSKAVAKLLGEAGVSAFDRPTVPLALDARDRVLWVPGVAVSVHLGIPPGPGGTGSEFFLSCERAGRA